MSSLLYDAAEKSVINLVQTHTLTHLLQQDEEQLRSQSHHLCYYHPKIDRHQAEQLLKNQNNKSPTNGLFLIRDCTTSVHDLSLSLVFNDKCYHYKIQRIHDNYFSIDSGPQIGGVENLIVYYQKCSDGLICVLAKEFLQGQPLSLAVRAIGLTNTLHRACQQGQYSIVKQILLTDQSLPRPDINGKDSHGSTALHQASYLGHDSIVRLLIKAQCHLLARDASGATALHRAAAGNRPSTLLILITEGLADYEERNHSNNWVPLHEAAFYNSVACVHVLLNCGAPNRPRTEHGKTPLQLAEEVRSDETMEILRQYKSPPAKSCRSDWLHDQIDFDRFAARELIESAQRKPSNGLFIVRHSSKNSRNYALTVCYEKECFNFEIIRLNETSFYIDDGPLFDSLEHLIDHYCRIPDGLPTTLTCSINQSKEVVPNRIQPSTGLYTYNKTKDIPLSFIRRTNGNEKAPPAKVSTSLSSSITSLTSSSSRSRASSIQESSLSTSSSSASLSGLTPFRATVLTSVDENAKRNRRNTIGGKVHLSTSDTLTEKRIKRSVDKQRLNLISPSRIQQTAKLGEGEFGEVYQGFYQEKTQAIPVAIKVLKDYSYSAKQDFLREAEHMSRLNHHCICKLYGIVDSNSNDMMMIIELLLLGSMLDYLWKHQLSTNETRLKLWATQIADGMEYMEYKGIVHRDLAARNILLQSIDQVKISDFGLSRNIEKDIYVQKSDSKIPVKWYAPEAISIGKFTSKSDVWSFGVTLWEMFSYAATPYGDMSGSDVYYSLKQGRRLDRPVRCPNFIYEIMLKCWEWDEKKRPTFDQLVQLLKTPFHSRQTQEIFSRSLSILEKNENHLLSKSVVHF